MMCMTSYISILKWHADCLEGMQCSTILNARGVCDLSVHAVK